MSTKGTIKKVVRREGVVFTYPRYVIIDEFKDEPQGWNFTFSAVSLADGLTM